MPLSCWRWLYTRGICTRISTRDEKHNSKQYIPCVTSGAKPCKVLYYPSMIMCMKMFCFYSSRGVYKVHENMYNPQHK